MTRIRLFIIFLFSSLLSSAQIDLATITEGYCPCFKEMNEKDIRNCIFNIDRIDRKAISSFFSEPSNIVYFFDEMDENCSEFHDHFAYKWESSGSISDKESNQRVFYVLSYFTDISSLDTLPKQVRIDKNEAGLVFNILRNKIRKDQVLEPGSHDISWQDSLITFLTAKQELTSNFECSENNGNIFMVEATLEYRLKKETLPDLYENMGENYEKVILEPNLRVLISNNCIDYINLKDKSEVIERLKKELSGDYFIFEKMTINTQK